MLYNISNNLTTPDAMLITKGLRLYLELTLDSCGDVDILGIWDPNPLLNDVDREVRATMSVEETCFAVVHNHSLSTDALLSIYYMFQDALDQYDITNGEIGLLESMLERRIAVDICDLIRYTVKELRS